MAELEFEKNLVVSTCHITETDSEKLFSNDNSSELIVHETEYYFLVYVNADYLSSAKDLSDSFLKLYQLAIDNECDYLKIDRDGPEIKGFQKYDW